MNPVPTGQHSCLLRIKPRTVAEDNMAKTLETGDKVAWRSSGGGSVGRVERKLTSPGKIEGHEIAASQNNPEFLVQSDKSGKVAAHKPSALRRVK
jgi:Hypervirulence associated proteins TUDOR domain